MSWWSGEAPKTSVAGYTPWIKSPGYDFSSTLYSYLTSMIGQQAPQFKGGMGGGRGMGGAAAGPQVAPLMQALMGLGKRYQNTGMPTVFGTGIGSMGRFLAPSFQNPVARLQMGAPNYFGSQQVPPQIPPASSGMTPWAQDPGMGGGGGGFQNYGLSPTQDMGGPPMGQPRMMMPRQPMPMPPEYQTSNLPY